MANPVAKYQHFVRCYREEVVVSQFWACYSVSHIDTVPQGADNLMDHMSIPRPKVVFHGNDNDIVGLVKRGDVLVVDGRPDRYEVMFDPHVWDGASLEAKIISQRMDWV